MRFIHTGDWHLGRLFHGAHLTDDQRHVLNQLVDLAARVKPDVVLVAGDVYDRAVPPPEAVDLLDEVLSRLVLDLELPVVLIAGNHDSPGRLNFGSRLLAGRRLYVTGNLPKACEPLVLSDADGPVHFYAVPYAEPATVRACLGCDGAGVAADLPDHDSAMREVLNRVRRSHPAGARSVVVAHAFVAGGSESESERPLTVGGAGTVGADCFDGFHYAALGHLHRPQAAGGGPVRYCGSLLKYSFDEAAGDKSVVVVEMDGAGACRCETVPLKPRRDVRRVSGTLAQLLAVPDDGGPAGDDYLEVMLTDDGPVLDAVGRLRERYPNVMSVRRPAREPAAAGGAPRPAAQPRALDDAVLFRSFFAHVRGAAPTDEQCSAYAAVVGEMRRKEREVV